MGLLRSVNGPVGWQHGSDLGRYGGSCGYGRLFGAAVRGKCDGCQQGVFRRNALVYILFSIIIFHQFRV